MIDSFECVNCHTLYEPIECTGLCSCGGLLLPTASERSIAIKELLHNTANLWRYKEYFLRENTIEWKEITMGEGFTPLISLDRDNPSIMLKLEFLSPLSGAHDRGYAVLAVMHKLLGIEESGINPKTEQERHSWKTYMHRAKLKGIPEAEGKSDTEPYYHPFFLTGIQTYAYEIWEQLSGEKLEFIVFPTDDPSFIIGAFLGFKHLLESKNIEEYPAFLLVEKEDSRIAHQPDSVKDQIMKIMDLTKGKKIIIAQAEIIQAKKALKARAIKSNEDDALLYAGFMRYYRDHSIKDQLAVLPIGLMNGGV